MAWRSREPSRLEGFSDAVFGFALTLLVVTLDVPRTVDELMTVVHGVLGARYGPERARLEAEANLTV